MSDSALTKESWMHKETMVSRAAEAYGVAAHNLFNITGGPVLIYLLGGMSTAAAGGAATMATTISGVAGEGAPVDIGTGAAAAGAVWCTPLNAAGVIAGSAAALPLTTVLLHPPQGMLAGTATGVIIGTVAVAIWTGVIFCLYRRLTPASLITVA